MADLWLMTLLCLILVHLMLWWHFRSLHDQVLEDADVMFFFLMSVDGLAEPCTLVSGLRCLRFS